jgi:UDP-hydrolysing UDP-N-acetyl-D-glucosamine 2-epimerase
MIGDGWDDGTFIRPGQDDAGGERRRRRVAVVTGSRAEFGLLVPVMRAVQKHPGLELLCIAAGSHLIQPADTFRDVKALFPIADSVPMQIAGKVGMYEDAESVGRGVGRFARSFDRLRPDWIVVLGDRIEAFAAATAAAISGFAVAHTHGGDRAEGIADESMRHAITKLAHVHLAATPGSAERIAKMGERPGTVFCVGSPSIDPIKDIPELEDSVFDELGRPNLVLLQHPVGRHPEMEEAGMMSVIEGLNGGDQGDRIVVLHPNFDPGRDGIMRAVKQSGIRSVSHLPREHFVGLLKRLAKMDGAKGGLLVGNSSAGLIEAAAVGLPVVNIGSRQNGREHASNVVSCAESAASVRQACGQARQVVRGGLSHPFGDGRAGERIAEILARINPGDAELRRKLCTY